MKYQKVKWLHNFDDEPIWFYNESDSNRTERRKIEIFPNGKYAYAYEGGAEGTLLTDVYMSSEEEINSDPQFIATAISKDEFEQIWNKVRSGTVELITHAERWGTL